MPKIVINEYDLTKAGTGEYENFSVVVPGFVGANCDESVFDENGIYECSSQADFDNYIGKRSAEVVTSKLIVEAELPKIDFSIEYCPSNVSDITPIKDDAGTIIGYQYKEVDAYEEALNALIHNKFDRASGGELNDTTVPETRTYKIYYAVKNDSGKVGKLCDKDNYYFEISTDTDSAITHTLYPEVATDTTILEIQPLFAAAHDAYFVIQEGDEGKNGTYIEDRITHYGNQIAHELLGLGYTVLFKKMSEHNDKKLEDIVYEKNDNGEVPRDEDGNVLDGVDFDSNTCDDIDSTEDGVTAVLKPEFSAAICELADPNFWECLRDKSTYDFRYLVTGLLTNNDGANSCIISIAEHIATTLDDATIKDGRGDCIALIDIDSAAYTGTFNTQAKAIPELAKQAAKWASAYAACFAPYVSYILADDAAYANNKIFPASFHYLACAANSKNSNFAEWYANAGYTRGVAKYTIESTGCKFGEIAVQSLEPRFLLNVGKELNDEGTAYNDINTSVAVNLIIKIKSSYYLWGNRTCKKLGTRGASDGDLVAQHFLNIRQLCTTIKKQVYTTCRRLTFDPNSNVLWINFRGLLAPMLEEMKADQGIRDYEFIRDFTDRKALLKARIRIVPIEAVEDFEIGLYLEDSLEDVVLTEA